LFAVPSLKGLPAQFHLEPVFFDARPRRQPDDVAGMITAKIVKTRSDREISEKLKLGQRPTLPAQYTRIFGQTRDKSGQKVRERRGSLGNAATSITPRSTINDHCSHFGQTRFA